MTLEKALQSARKNKRRVLVYESISFPGENFTPCTWDFGMKIKNETTVFMPTSEGFRIIL